MQIADAIFRGPKLFGRFMVSGKGEGCTHPHRWGLERGLCPPQKKCKLNAESYIWHIFCILLLFL